MQIQEKSNCFGIILFLLLPNLLLETGITYRVDGVSSLNG
jgi:hypothetical protein